MMKIVQVQCDLKTGLGGGLLGTESHHGKWPVERIRVCDGSDTRRQGVPEDRGSCNEGVFVSLGSAEGNNEFCGCATCGDGGGCVLQERHGDGN